MGPHHLIIGIFSRRASKRLYEQKPYNVIHTSPRLKYIALLSISLRLKDVPGLLLYGYFKTNLAFSFALIYPILCLTFHLD